jgi:glycosyltransferase involved in cell wall biosynthesis
MRESKKILISSNTVWSLVNFRLNLIKSLINDGYLVIAASADGLEKNKLESIGCKFIALPIKQKGKSLLSDAWLLYYYLRLMHREKPDFYLAFTVKPNIYGSLAAMFFGVSCVNNIAGLGIIFLKDNLLTKLVKFLYRISLTKSRMIFFQNDDDRYLFEKIGILNGQSNKRLPGSGVDLSKFKRESPLIRENEKLKFLMAARLLREKGVYEFVEAAKLVKIKYPECEFILMGFLDDSNLHEINMLVISKWENEELITFKPASNDIKAEIEQVDCVVLPSYYPEGVPRILLEASSMSTPIITTDNTGCRDAVEDNITGFVVPIKDAFSLAKKFIDFIEIGCASRNNMGNAGRLKMELQFNEKIIINAYADALNHNQ